MYVLNVILCYILYIVIYIYIYYFLVINWYLLDLCWILLTLFIQSLAQSYLCKTLVILRHDNPGQPRDNASWRLRPGCYFARHIWSSQEFTQCIVFINFTYLLYYDDNTSLYRGISQTRVPPGTALQALRFDAGGKSCCYSGTAMLFALLCLSQTLRVGCGAWPCLRDGPEWSGLGCWNWRGARKPWEMNLQGKYGKNRAFLLRPQVIPGQIVHAAGAPVVEDGHTTVSLQTGGAIDVSTMANESCVQVLVFWEKFPVILRYKISRSE